LTPGTLHLMMSNKMAAVYLTLLASRMFLHSQEARKLPAGRYSGIDLEGKSGKITLSN
jgi:hypothetical protein